MLTVAGRRTGRPHATRMVPGRVGECRYPVSRYRQADRARNLRSAGEGEGELRGRGGTALFATQEVPFAERATVIAAHPVVAGRTVEQCFREPPDPVDRPVFVIERVGSAT